MAIANEWTDPDTLEMSSGDTYRATNVNGILGNLGFLYSGPRVAVARESSLTVDSQSFTQITWDEVLVDEGGWVDSSPTSTVVVPRDGMYMVTARLLWPDNPAGDFRAIRILRDGEPIAGQRFGACRFAEHDISTQTALTEGRAISVDVRHDAEDESLTVDSYATPWRSPVLIVKWFAPLNVEV